MKNNKLTKLNKILKRLNILRFQANVINKKVDLCDNNIDVLKKYINNMDLRLDLFETIIKSEKYNQKTKSMIFKNLSATFYNLVFGSFIAALIIKSDEVFEIINNFLMKIKIE